MNDKIEKFQEVIKILNAKNINVDSNLILQNDNIKIAQLIELNVDEEIITWLNFENNEIEEDNLCNFLINL